MKFVRFSDTLETFGPSTASEKLMMAWCDDLAWREVFPGRYERGVDEAEQFYTSKAKTYEGTGHTYFAITAFAGLSLSRSFYSHASDLDSHVENALRYAWKRLRFEHPTLAAPVEFDPITRSCKKVYQTLSGNAQVDAWMNETFKLVDTGQSGQDFADSDPPVGRLATLYLVTRRDQISTEGPSLRRDLVFRSSHDLIDGIGTLTLLNNLIGHMASAFEDATSISAEFGSEYRNLSPPLRVAAGLPLSPRPEQVAKLAAIKAQHTLTRENVEILSFPFKMTTIHPGNSQRVATPFTREESSAIIAKSKALGSSVTQIFHTAIALAVRDLQDKTEYPREGRYNSYSLVNLRHCCIPPYHKPRHAASVYHCVSAAHLVVDLTIASQTDDNTAQSPEEFLTTLSQVRSFYENATIDADYLSIVPSLFSAVTPEYVEGPCDIPAPNESPSVSLSSMGIVDKIIQPRHGPFTVLEPWVMGAEYSTGLGTFLGTWEGRLSLSAGFNEAFHGREKVLAFLERMKVIVLEGLEINGWQSGSSILLRTV